MVDCVSQPLKVPAQAEIVIEGEVSLDEQGDEGPYGDHTGYYNSVERFPLFKITAITRTREADLPEHLHRPTAGRAERSGRSTQRGLCAALAAAVS